MLNVPSVLDAVTVFSQGALCTRLATVKPESGRSPERVRLSGLPLLLKAGSLRASVRRGPAGVLVRELHPELEVELPKEADLPAEQHELEAAEARLEQLETEAQLLIKAIDAVRRLEPSFLPPAKGAPPRPSAAPAILELASFVDTELEPLQSKLFVLEDALKAQAQEVELRRQRIREGSSGARAQRARVSRAVVVTLSGDAGTDPVELAIEYVVMAARWAPAYELDLARSMDSGLLRLRANVLQRTGEDWSGVKLSFSTANLDRRSDAPELKSLRIGRRQAAPPRSGWREPPPGLEELFADFDAVTRNRAPPRREELMQTRAGSIGAYASAPSVLDEGAPELSAEMGTGHAMPMPKAARAGSSVEKRAPMAPPPSPPPLAQAAPMPMRARATAAPKGGLSRPAPADMDALYESEESMDDAPMMDGAFGGGGGGGGPGGAPEPSSLEVDQSLLDYDALELPPLRQGADRGQLRRRAGLSRQELLVLQSVSVNVNVVQLVAVLQAQAQSSLDTPAPRYSVVPRDAAAFFDYRYDVEHRTSLASDGSWHSLPVFKADVAMEAEYLVVPSVEPRAFRTVRLTNRTPHALLAGPVDVRIGGEFLMTSPFPTLSPGGAQRLGLGVEESIKVSRNTRFDEATGGVFGGATVLTHGVDIEVSNRLSHPILVEVRERVPAIPVGEKDIKIDETQVAPGWQKPKELPGDAPVEGERAWRVPLKANESQKLSATFVVKIPASKMLDGGNRRA